MYPIVLFVSVYGGQISQKVFPVEGLKYSLLHGLQEPFSPGSYPSVHSTMQGITLIRTIPKIIQLYFSRYILAILHKSNFFIQP